jgi:Amt family ammonium transporter
MEDEGTIQKNIADKLISALKTGGFLLYAQQILPLAGSERPFQEILVRFREEEEKLLPPGTFFPMLQEYRLLPYLDRWVVSRLASWVQESRARTPGWPVPANGVNLSEDTLREPKFADFVAKNIENSKLPEGVFTFELAWDTALLHAEPLKSMQAQLGPLGCRFTFAGFDGSEGSFSFLKILKPDFVKLTYGTVKDVGKGLAASEKVESINSKCHAMGIKTIAEFVESQEVLDQLRLIEVDFAQGLIIGGPHKLV